MTFLVTKTAVVEAANRDQAIENFPTGRIISISVAASAHSLLQLARNPKSQLRPGDLLSAAIRKITGLGPCPAKCRQHINVMNQKGWLWCLTNRKLIATWLAEAARSRGHKITDDSALYLLKAAFRELRDRRSASALQPGRNPPAPPLHF